MKQVTIRTHGAAKGDPGASAIAVSIIDASEKVLVETKEAIGNATDFYAAFMAVMRGLAMASEEFGAKTTDTKFTVIISNEEVKRQVNGEAPVTNPGIVPYFIEIHNMRVASFPNLSFEYVPPKQSEQAVSLVNEALDAA